MGLSQPVQSGASDVQRELLTRRYATAAPVEAVLPGTKTVAPKAEEKHAFGGQDWFERSTDKADGGRTALKNMLERMKKLADANAEREAAERVAATGSPAAPVPENTQVAAPAVPTGWWAPASVASDNNNPDAGSGSGSTTTEPAPTEPDPGPPKKDKDKGLLGLFG
jgi:hypothetical protein